MKGMVSGKEALKDEWSLVKGSFKGNMKGMASGKEVLKDGWSLVSGFI